MTVIMVLLTFAIFLLIDYVRGQKQTAKQPVVVHAIREAAPRVVPAMVAGFEVPENVRYHAGHTWALSESSELVRVGIDDFASKLIGKIESIALPQRGRWVRQGQKIWTIFRRQIRRHGFADRRHNHRCQRSGGEESGTGAQRSVR